jgi:hypothetical protein
MEEFLIVKIVGTEVTARLSNFKKQAVSTEIASHWFSDLQREVDRNKKLKYLFIFNKWKK